MKRTINSSVLSKKPRINEDEQAKESTVESTTDVVIVAHSEPTSGFKPRVGGSGSAWKAGAQAETQTLLNEKREQIANDILHGRHELELSSDQISDELGSDRREDWRDQQAFAALSNSIENNGQDTPIQVWPADPNWRPDTLEPVNVAGVPFLLIVGRRRHAILLQLGRPIRAILADPEKRGTSDDVFEMLFMRFRENEERENLGAFERLLSVGEMYERFDLANPNKKITAVAFAKQIGVHESHISRGKAVYTIRKEILHACKNVYDLSHRELEKVVADLSTGPQIKAKSPEKPEKVTITRKFGDREMSVFSQSGKISISSTGMNLDKQALEGLSDIVATYLQEQGL